MNQSEYLKEWYRKNPDYQRQYYLKRKAKMKKICKGCGNVFMGTFANRKFCTEQCHKDYFDRNGKTYRIRSVMDGLCRKCHKPTGKPTNARFCDECLVKRRRFNAKYSKINLTHLDEVKQFLKGLTHIGVVEAYQICHYFIMITDSDMQGTVPEQIQKMLDVLIQICEDN